MSDTQERPVLDECRYVARELEVYGAEDEPRVNVHKHLFRLAAALIRRNADALQASEEREQRLRALCEEGLQRVRDLCENKAVNEMVKNAPWNAVYDLARAIRVAIEAALATPRGEVVKAAVEAYEERAALSEPEMGSLS